MNENYLNIKNPDEMFRKEVISRIKANGGYCINKFERTPDTKCHCKEFRETGVCACGLFLKIPCYEVEED